MRILSRSLALGAQALTLAAAFLLLVPFPARAQPGPTGLKASMSEVYEAANQPLEADPVVSYTATSLATIETPFSALSSAQQTIRYSQEIVVENLHATISVCVFSVAAGAVCTSDADASCLGGADPKPVIAPGKSRKFRYAGTRVPCTITSAVAGEFQVERIVRQVGAR